MELNLCFFKKMTTFKRDQYFFKKKLVNNDIYIKIWNKYEKFVCKISRSEFMENLPFYHHIGPLNTEFKDERVIISSVKEENSILTQRSEIFEVIKERSSPELHWKYLDTGFFIIYSKTDNFKGENYTIMRGGAKFYRYDCNIQNTSGMDIFLVAGNKKCLIYDGKNSIMFPNQSYSVWMPSSEDFHICIGEQAKCVSACNNTIVVHVSIRAYTD